MPSMCNRSKRMRTPSRSQSGHSRGSTSSWNRKAAWCGGMRSSSLGWRGDATAMALATALVLAAACSSRDGEAPSDRNGVVQCSSDGVATGDAAVTTVRQKAEAGPLYAMLAGASPVASCVITVDESRVGLEYAFGDGGKLQVTVDPRIEYGDQEARFTSEPAEDPVEILKRAERAAFPDGCGVNWDAPETGAARDETVARETIYRGDTCSCQARVGQGASGRLTSLSFRSAC